MTTPREPDATDILIATDKCPRCGHQDADHINNHCRDGCDCFIGGSEARHAAGMWNAFMGRP